MYCTDAVSQTVKDKDDNVEPLILGIDIGTSACKAALFKKDGTPIAIASASYPTAHPRPGWAEQAPDDWWHGVCKALHILWEKEDPQSVVGVGIDGQSWAAVAVDDAGNVLCPSPIWMDTRASQICDRLGRTIGTDKIFAVSGNPLSPSYTLPKVLWYKEHWPDTYAKMSHVLQCNSFIVYRLTGALTQDLSQGYGLHCFDLQSGTYHTALCEEMGINPKILPEIMPCHHIAGTITKEAAEACGLPVGIPVVAGGLDAACATLGVGVLQSGQAQLQGGQAGGMSICTPEYKVSPALITSYHVIPGHWLVQGGTVGGGGVLRWFKEKFGNNEDFGQLTAQAEEIPPGSDGLVFLPYMAGERSPIWDKNAKGMYYGLDYTKTKAHTIRAAMEGVAFSIRHNMEVAAKVGVTPNEMRAMGGAANSALWMQIKADIVGKRIYVPSSDTATTLGAAILAGVAVGLYEDFDDAVTRTVTIKRAFEPNPENYEVYNKNYFIYRELYERLKEL